ncbi:hypothetical protein COU37_05400 [Candidatus Micrarchaeota archaeon CG10_big_fil_rev_8_21_14_0_10_45_29]|nr:MAG: hypothetical protein COU37_05400 [Candidatus Micrarchaeota archaeon CG10_big_fil_rev_8_21_14_0_10_45_29]
MKSSIIRPIKTFGTLAAFTTLAILSSNKTLAQTMQYPILKQGIATELPDTSKRIKRIYPGEGAIKGLPAEIDSSAIKGELEAAKSSKPVQEAISNKGFYDKKKVLEKLNPAHQEKLGIIGTDKDSTYLLIDYWNANIKKICRQLGFSGVVHSVLLPLNKEAYEAFEKEAKEHSKKYKQNALSYTDSLIVAKAEQGDIFYILLGAARNTGDASTEQFDGTYDKWHSSKTSQRLGLCSNGEVRIPFDGDFGIVRLANYPNSYSSGQEEPSAQSQHEATAPEISRKIESAEAKKDTVVVPLILALNLEGFVMEEKNMYFNECYNYLLDFRASSPEEIMQAYKDWLLHKKTIDAQRELLKKAQQETIYKNSFEGY